MTIGAYKSTSCAAVEALPHYEAEARKRQWGGQGGVLLSEKIHEAKDKAADHAARDFKVMPMAYPRLLTDR